VKFDFEESTAHSRDVLELNLRRLSGSISCAPKARERKRSSLNCMAAARQRAAIRIFTPQPGLYGWYKPGFIVLR